MKKTINSITRLVVIGVTFALVAAAYMPVAVAKQTLESCEINLAHDDEDSTNSMYSIRSVEEAFNAAQEWQACKSTWTFASDVTLKHTIMIKGNTEGTLTIDGGGHVLTADSGELDTNKCIIRILTDNVTITNLKVEHGGICIGMEAGEVFEDVEVVSATEITLNGVVVKNSQGDGIRVTEKASKLHLIGGTKVIDSVKAGIRFLGTMEAKGFDILDDVTAAGPDPKSFAIVHTVSNTDPAIVTPLNMQVDETSIIKTTNGTLVGKIKQDGGMVTVTGLLIHKLDSGITDAPEIDVATADVAAATAKATAYVEKLAAIFDQAGPAEFLQLACNGINGRLDVDGELAAGMTDCSAAERDAIDPQIAATPQDVASKVSAIKSWATTYAKEHDIGFTLVGMSDVKVTGDFVLNANDLGLTNTNYLVAVPVIQSASEDVYGTSIQLSKLWNIADALDCQGGGCETDEWNSGLWKMGMSTELECTSKVGMFLPLYDFFTDTDRDGLVDAVEMRLRIVDRQVNGAMAKVIVITDSALCATADAVSDWTTPDTDGDGIMDLKELRCADGSTPQNWSNILGSESSPPSLCGHISVAETVNNILQYVIVDAAGVELVAHNVLKDSDNVTLVQECKDINGHDGVLDVRDPDSDCDNTPDWVEDRARLFKSGANLKAYLVEAGSTLMPLIMKQDKDHDGKVDDGSKDEMVECSSNPVFQYDDAAVIKGISYGIYIVDYKSGAIERLTVQNAADYLDPQAKSGKYSEMAKVKALACVSAPLISSGGMGSNFNGQYDADGMDCDDYMTYQDKPVNSCREGCINGEILKFINDVSNTYTNIGHTSLVMEEGSNVPKLFADVLNGKINPDELNYICQDYDSDGIPNCVEAAVSNKDYLGVGNCTGKYRGLTQQPQVGEKFDMSPYNPDSDGDGFPDGFMLGENLGSIILTGNPDKCPMKNGPTDDAILDLVAFGSEGDEVSCDPYDLYKSHPVNKILAFYLDRDADGIRDMYEYVESTTEQKGKNKINMTFDSEEHKKDLAAAFSQISAFGDISQNQLSYITDPLRTDSELDGLSDLQEVKDFGTYPRHNDSDGDKLTDGIEVKVGEVFVNDFTLGVAGEIKYGCGVETPSSPISEDTDDDGLNDYIEVMITHTSPVDVDSDGDTLCDGTVDVADCTGHELKTVPTEANLGTEGAFEFEWNESNPCDANTDKDNWPDGSFEKDLADNCPNIFDNTNSCQNIGSCGPDADGDNLPDDKEIEIGTDQAVFDTDGDGLCDGCCEEAGGKTMGELCNAQMDCYKSVAVFQTSNCTPPDYMDCDTDPINPDVDTDGVSDGNERRYSGERNGVIASPSNPRNYDTDGDCIPDGPSMLPDGTMSSGENKNGNATWDVDETLASAVDLGQAFDTDGDGLPDGWPTGSIMYEDKNCNGIMEQDETSPLMADSNGDGLDDYGAMYWGGMWNPMNIDRAKGSGMLRGRGCSLNTGGTASWDIVAMMALLIAAAVVVRVRLRKNER